MKTIATMVGLAIGDSIGMPFEFCSYEEINTWWQNKEWTGQYLPGGIDGFDLQPGQWTDDTYMAIALAESLIAKNGYDLDATAQKYIDWYNTGDLRGIGLQTEAAIKRLIAGENIFKCGELTGYNGADFNPNICGNGTAMRAAPLGLYYKNKISAIKDSSYNDANLTHNHQSAFDASQFVAEVVAHLANDQLDEFVIMKALFALPKHSIVRSQIHLAINLAVLNVSIKEASEKLGSNGTAHETVASAVFCYLTTDNFKDAVINSVRIGGDTDTRAAICGAWAGTKYGLEDIPDFYKENLEKFEHLKELDKKLIAHTIQFV